MYSEKKDALLAVILHHKSKVDEAVEALELLRSAMLAMNAEEGLRELLERENPIAQLIASEFTNEALYGPLLAAETHIKEARRTLDRFFRIVRDSYVILQHGGQGND